MTSMKKRIAAALTAGILAAALALPAAAAEAPPIRVSSYKGSTLDVGERSGLMISPGGTDYTVTSSDPDTVAVEQMLTFRVAVPKAEGSTETISSNRTGGRGHSNAAQHAVDNWINPSRHFLTMIDPKCNCISVG